MAIKRMELAKGILSKPPAYTPGSEQLYSNAGFSIAGAMIERIMDQSYEKLMHDLLFKPLGMDSAGFRAPADNGKVDQPYGHTKRFFQVIPVDRACKFFCVNSLI